MAIIPLTNIKNIIFDLGGVILNIDYQLTVEAFKKIGIKNFDSLFSKAQQNKLFDSYETGQISSADFVNEIKTIANNNLTNTQIIAAWNAMLLDLPPNRITLLNSLKDHFRIFLLSNTNEIHKIAYCNYLNETFGFNDFSGIFEKQYLSFEIGLRKPNEEIFNYVLEENNLTAEETIFIDDSIQHVVGAQKTGIQAIHLKENQSILNLFE